MKFSQKTKNILALLLILAVATPLSWYVVSTLRGGESFGLDVEAARPSYLNPLSGALVKTKQQQSRQVVTVMIDNHPEARPPTGVSSAYVVIEAPVEGQFTRYLAVFDGSQKVVQVGPVRSARPYFLDWASEYGRPLYLHSGGSPDALKLLSSNAKNVADVNEFYWGDHFWRSADRAAPHNLFTKTELWQSILAKDTSAKPMDAGSGWKYARIIGRPNIKDVTKAVAIPYNKQYTVTWQFDPKRQDYVRYINGVKYVDSDGSEVRAFNVLIQSAPIKVLDDEGRLEIGTIGKGKAQMLKKGLLLDGSWKKGNLTARTRFYQNDGKELVLLPGKTWVEVVPSDVVLNITK